MLRTSGRFSPLRLRVLKQLMSLVILEYFYQDSTVSVAVSQAPEVWLTQITNRSHSFS